MNFMKIAENRQSCRSYAPEKDVEANEKLLEEIKAFGTKTFDEYHKPQVYYFLDKIPYTKAGKVDYRALEEKAKK